MTIQKRLAFSAVTAVAVVSLIGCSKSNNIGEGMSPQEAEAFRAQQKTHVGSPPQRSVPLIVNRNKSGRDGSMSGSSRPGSASGMSGSSR